MRVLVTGADGFVGRYLVRVLASRGYEVIAGVLNSTFDFDTNVERISFNIVEGDRVNHAIRGLQPDGIIHLAALSMVKSAWDNPVDTLMVNTVGTINIVKAVSLFSRHTKIVTIGSSEEYGLTGKFGKPLTEEDCCLPQNPYGTSKLAAGQMALQLAIKDQINVVHVRPFNHFGPYQRIGFVVSDFASQIAKIENGLAEPILKVGDLSARRDFTHVEDIVEAYILILEKNIETGIYNICSGEPHTASEILDILLSHCKVKVEVKIDTEIFRPANVPLFIGSANKIRQTTGWKPNKDFVDSLVETLNWWRSQESFAVATLK